MSWLSGMHITLSQSCSFTDGIWTVLRSGTLQFCFHFSDYMLCDAVFYQHTLSILTHRNLAPESLSTVEGKFLQKSALLHHKCTALKSKEAQRSALWLQEKPLQGQPMKPGSLSPVLQPGWFLTLQTQCYYGQPKLSLLIICKLQAISVPRTERVLQTPF